MSAPKGDPDRGDVRLVTAPDRSGAAWDLIGRIEPMPGCAADVVPGYRLSLIARRRGAEGETIRITAHTVYPTYARATAALSRLVGQTGNAPGGGTGGDGTHTTMDEATRTGDRLPSADHPG